MKNIDYTVYVSSRVRQKNTIRHEVYTNDTNSIQIRLMFYPKEITEFDHSRLKVFFRNKKQPLNMVSAIDKSSNMSTFIIQDLSSITETITIADIYVDLIGGSVDSPNIVANVFESSFFIKKDITINNYALSIAEKESRKLVDDSLTTKLSKLEQSLTELKSSFDSLPKNTGDDSSITTKIAQLEQSLKDLKVTPYDDSSITTKIAQLEQSLKDLKTSLKSELLSELPTIPNYTLSLDGNILKLGKEGDESYAKTIDLSKYVDGPSIDVEKLKKDILSNINIPNTDNIKEEILRAIPTIPNYTVSLEEDTLVLTKEGDESYRKTIDLSKYKDQTVNVEQLKNEVLSAVESKIPTNESIKNAVLTEVNPKLIDKESLKTELLNALPSSPNYTLSLEDNTLKLGKEGDTSYSKTIDLSKYVNGPSIDVEQLKTDIKASITVPNPETIKADILKAIPKYRFVLNEDTLTYGKELDNSEDQTVDLSKYKDGVNSLLSSIRDLNRKSSLNNIPEPIATLAEIFAASAPPAKFLLGNNNSSLDLLFKNSDSYYEYTPNESKKNDPHTVIATLTREQLKSLLGPISATSDNPTLSLEDNILKLGKESDPTYSKTVDLSKYANVINTNIMVGIGRPDKEDHDRYNINVKGMMYIDKDVTDGAFLWLRTDRWRVVIGDTGWRPLNTINTLGKSKIEIRRVNNSVYIQFGGLTWGLFGHKKFSQIIDKKDARSFRVVEPGQVPDGYRQQGAYIGSIISDIKTPGQIVGTYYIGGITDSNFIKIFYSNIDVPDAEISDWRLQPGTWSVDPNQPWPKL